MAKPALRSRSHLREPQEDCRRDCADQAGSLRTAISPDPAGGSIPAMTCVVALWIAVLWASQLASMKCSQCRPLKLWVVAPINAPSLLQVPDLCFLIFLEFGVLWCRLRRATSRTVRGLHDRRVHHAAARQRACWRAATQSYGSGRHSAEADRSRPRSRRRGSRRRAQADPRQVARSVPRLRLGFTVRGSDPFYT